MLSFRIVVRPGASAAETPASSNRRSMSDRIVSGVTLRTATLLPTGYLRVQRNLFAGVLLDDGEKSSVQEPDLEQHQKWNSAVDLGGQRVEDGRGEVQAERQLDER